MTTLADVLRRAERLRGEELAVQDGEVRLTYRALADRCRGLAGALRELGVRPGDRVATLMLNGHRYLEAQLAIPAAGAVLVPLNTRHALAEQRAILADAGARVLIVDWAHATFGEALAHDVVHVVAAPQDYDAIVARAERAPLGEGVEEDDLAGLFYTGGTTGAAKGVMLTHRNLVANALHTALALGYREDDVYLHAAPMFHLGDGASTYAITWMGGGHAFVPSFDAGLVLRTIEETRATVTMTVPAMIAALIDHPALDATELSSLRMMLHGAAPIGERLLVRAMQALYCSFFQAYGMTEAAPILTDLAHEERLVGDARLRSAGREVAGVEIAVMDADGRPCPSGTVGEIVARGPNLTHGYWRRPQETAAALHDGWYWSGDVGYLDADGYLFLVDRAKDMLISGGENVYSVEVERVVGAHPAVADCAVVGLPDERWGERVHAVVVPAPGRTVELDELRAFCRGRLAGYKCPKSLELRDELPRSAAGKVLKRVLRAQAGQEVAR